MTGEELLDIIRKTFRIQEEEKMYQIYVQIYPHMTQDTFKTFNEFIGKTESEKPKEKPKEKTIEEIMFDVENICNVTKHAKRGR